ncbi:MAG: chain-length determining protein [Prevotella sp.]|nr:chain-length determining protein [Candidatus Equicola stercoris]
MEDNDYRPGIDYKEVWHRICEKRKLFFKIVPIVMVLSVLYILCIPRTYTCIIKLAPEYDLASAGNLNSLAAQFGLDVGNSFPSTDAISPTLYPDLIKSTNFVVSLFPIQVVNKEGTIKTDYFTYLKDHQKSPFWSKAIYWIKNLFTKKEGKKATDKVDPFRLTKKETDILKQITKQIKCSVDKKTDVITFTIIDQDPLICACIADSVSTKLQSFITEYRTSKARNDVEYYERLLKQAKHDYVKSRQIYGDYADSHADINLPSFQAKIDDLENEMQLKYNAYNTIQAQLQAAKAKVQEKTPAFTTLQSATVPIKATGPKRMIFVAVLTLLAFIGTALYVLRDILKP